MSNNWKDYFDDLAKTRTEEHGKVGWGSEQSMYSKFYPSLAFLPLNGQKTLLDVGCGTGAFEKLLLDKYPSLNVHALDISEEQVNVLKRKNLPVTIKIGSITDIPYPDDTFDCVTSFGVLQNFDGAIEEALGELTRVLKPGGRIFVVTMDADYVGFKSGERTKNPLNTYFVPDELRKVFESCGVTKIEMGAISSEKREGVILPLHRWHTFFVFGIKHG